MLQTCRCTNNETDRCSEEDLVPYSGYGNTENRSIIIFIWSRSSASQGFFLVVYFDLLLIDGAAQLMRYNTLRIIV